MKRKITKAFVKKVSEKEGLLTAVVGSTAAVDRYGEIVDQASWDLKNYKKNPVILWAHNLSFGEDRPPIGRAVNVGIKAGKLVFDIQFDMADPFAADIFRKYKEKFLNAFSVGFMPHRVERVDDDSQPNLRAILKDNELLELSAVPVPANPEALNQLKLQSFRYRSWDNMVKEFEEEEGHEDAPVLETKEIKAKGKKPKPTKKEITDVTIPETKPGENKGGPDSDPKKTQQGEGNQKMIQVIREATRLFQGILAEHNQNNKK